jgi:quercetin dioxygenase-like cupin family protein
MEENKLTIRKFATEGDAFRWSDVGVKAYNAPGTVSRFASKQILFHSDDNLGAELRYFELGPGGHSALERHEHVHAVLILRGRGRVLVGRELTDIAEHDLVYTPPGTWHQFYAAEDSHLGFLCLVNGERDMPSRPTAEDLAAFAADLELASIIRQ